MKKDRRVPALRDMASMFLKAGYVLGGLITNGEDRIKERNLVQFGANYDLEVQRVFKTVDFGSGKNFKHRLCLFTAVEEVPKRR